MLSAEISISKSAESSGERFANVIMALKHTNKWTSSKELAVLLNISRTSVTQQLRHLCAYIRNKQKSVFDEIRQRSFVVDFYKANFTETLL